jgi:ribosome maturation factor RimP
MKLEDTPLWKTIDEVAREEGVALFDIDCPSDTSRGGILKVFITLDKNTVKQPVDGQGSVSSSEEQPQRIGISFEDCVRVSKRLLDLDEQSEIIPGNCSLEVSSPGINRKLRLPEHFNSAVGERLKVKFRDPNTGAGQVLVGRLLGSNGDMIEFEGETKKERFSIQLSDIREARIDFKF